MVLKVVGVAVGVVLMSEKYVSIQEERSGAGSRP